MGALGPLLASVSPLIVAALAQFGIVVTETEVNVWVNLALWVIAFVAFFSPSFRAWLKFKEDAK